MQSAFNALDLITALTSRGSPEIVSLASDEEFSSTAFDGLSMSSPVEHQTPITEKSSTAMHGHNPSSPIYRFSDRRPRASNHDIGQDSSIAPNSFPDSSSQPDFLGNGDHAELATKTWGSKQRIVLLNVNNERVDADLGPVDAEAERNLFRRTNQQKLCNNYVILGKCGQAACQYAHDAGLDAKEMIALIYRARLLPCDRGSGCRFSSCWYGHMCAARCTGGPKCLQKFHDVNRTAVKVWRPHSS